MTDLPLGWVKTSLGEICDRISDGSHNPPKKQSTGLPMLSAININGNSINFDSYRLISEAEFEIEDRRTEVQAYDVLLTIVGAIGRAAVVPKSARKFTLQRSVAVLRSAATLPRLLMHHLEEPTTAKFFKENARGTAQKGIYLKTLASTPILLPPLNEQRRIVEKIEAMFEEIDKGVESLQTARTNLGLYHQSLLKSAFDGRLTADWRVKNADKLEAPETLLARIQSERETRYKAALDAWQVVLAKWREGGEEGKKPAKPKRPKDFVGTAKIPSGVAVPIPAEWLTLPMSDLGQTTGGLTKNQKRNALPLKAKYLRVANVYSNRLELDEIMEIGVTEEELVKTSLLPGDLLFVEGNGSIEQIGRVAIWDGSIPKMTHQNHLIRFSADGTLSSRFALYFMMSPVGRKLIEAQASSTSGLHTLSISKIESLPVPICAPAEQAEITRILDVRLEAAGALEAEIDAALRRADALRQSILKKAFSGQLVSQDPEDEPAAALLERIKAEKAEREQTAKRDRKAAPPRKPKSRRPTLTDLIEVLEKQKGWITAAKAAQELGIGDNSTSDEVEVFYRQLKECVENIEIERRGDEDWLRLATAKVN